VWYRRTQVAGNRGRWQAPSIFWTAWVDDARGKNFMPTILRLATPREEARIVSDQTGPAWSREIARASSDVLAQLIQHSDIGAALSREDGTYHKTAASEAN